MKSWLTICLLQQIVQLVYHIWLECEQIAVVILASYFLKQPLLSCIIFCCGLVLHLLLYVIFFLKINFKKKIVLGNIFVSTILFPRHSIDNLVLFLIYGDPDIVTDLSCVLSTWPFNF